MADICSWVAFGRAPDGDIVVFITPMRPMPAHPQLLANCQRKQVDPASVWWARRDQPSLREQKILADWYRIGKIMMQRMVDESEGNE